MKLSEKIVNIRNDNNLTQEEFVEILGVSRQTVSNWENNKCYPDIEIFFLISEKFNVSFDNLLKDDIEIIKDIDKKVKSNKHKKIIIIILSILLIMSFYLGYKLFLLNYYDNGYSSNVYKNYFENLEQITVEKNDTLANHSFNDLNIYIPENISQYSWDQKFYIGSNPVISFYKYSSPFYEFLNTGEYYKNINYEKVFIKNDINHPVDLIRYFKILYDRKPTILWSKNNLELLFLMKNYVVLENDYDENNYKRYYWCNDLNGIMTEVGNNYEIEIFHEKETYLIIVDKNYYKMEQVQKILSSIYFD